MLRERHKQRTCEADSIEALPRGGQARSSDEAVVMAAERRVTCPQERVHSLS